MFKTLSNKRGGALIALTAIAVGSLYGCSKRDARDVQPTASPVTSTLSTGAASSADTTGTAAWLRFVARVEAGEIQDPTGQYVSNATQVASDGTSARPGRPSMDARKRTLASLHPSKPGRPGGIGTNFIQPDDPSGGGGGGAPAPNYSSFSSTEIVQPYDTPPATTSALGPKKPKLGKTNGFYSTENPNGFLYDLKIVKGSDADRPFHNNPYYHNIPANLNSGAGGQTIYISFTRDPRGVEYQHFSSSDCGDGGDEQPKSGYGPGAPYLDNFITDIDTRVNCCFGSVGKCYTTDTQVSYFPFWALGNINVNSDYMKFPDLNDGAGGAYVYAFLTRTAGYNRPPIEVGVLTGNNEYITPPAGWTRVGSNLNSGAGGDYIFLCRKSR